MKHYLFLTIGLPGSGKTHFALQFTKEQGVIHLSSDRLRADLFKEPKYTRWENGIVFGAIRYAAIEALSRGVSVLIDANFNQRFRRDSYYELAKQYKASPVLLWLKTPLDKAKQRTIKRKMLGDQRYYGDAKAEVIDKMLQHFEEPQADEPVIEIDGMATYSKQLRQLNFGIAKLLK